MLIALFTRQRKKKKWYNTILYDERSFIILVLDTIKKTLRVDGKVLLPVDSVGRVLELIQILESVSRENVSCTFLYCFFDNWKRCFLVITPIVTLDFPNYLQCWEEENLIYPIYFLTYVASSTIDYVKSFLEWMSDSIAKSFEKTRDNAFLLK